MLTGWRRLKNRQKGRLWAAAIVGLLLLADTFLPLTRPFEFLVQDALMRVHLAERAPASGIILINVDEYSLEQMSPEFGSWAACMPICCRRCWHKVRVPSFSILSFRTRIARIPKATAG